MREKYSLNLMNRRGIPDFFQFQAFDVKDIIFGIENEGITRELVI